MKKAITEVRTTLLEIANYCNLSRSTVSRVLNGNAGNFRISSETVETVLAAAKQLNYRPNRLARAIQSRRTHLIGISFPKYTVGDIAEEQRFANEHRIMGLTFSSITQHPLFSKYDLVIHTRNEHQDTPFNDEDLKQDLLDGIIYSNPSEKHIEFFKMLSKDIPLVIMGDVPALHKTVICVDINNRKMAAKATQHLLSTGRKNIMVLVPESVISAYCIQDRINGYRDALKAVGIKETPDLIRIIQCNQDAVSDFILTSPTINQIDAIFGLTDDVAMLCIDPLRGRGLKIPEDIAIMGFNGNDFFNEKARSLSTVQIPFQKMAMDATDKLLSVLENKTPYKPGFYEVSAELLIRESTIKQR